MEVLLLKDLHRLLLSHPRQTSTRERYLTAPRPCRAAASCYGPQPCRKRKLSERAKSGDRPDAPSVYNWVKRRRRRAVLSSHHSDRRLEAVYPPKSDATDPPDVGEGKWPLFKLATDPPESNDLGRS